MNMMSFYVDDEGTKHEVDKTTLQVMKDWVQLELIKVACFAEQSKVPCQVVFTIFNLMLEETISEMLGEIEDEN